MTLLSLVPPMTTMKGEWLWERSFAQSVDRLTTERFKIPGLVLMENAGSAVANVILDLDKPDGPIIVLAGLGNNGGDALVTARYLAESGYQVYSFLVPHRPDAKPTAACAQQIEILSALGQTPQPYKNGCLSAFAGEGLVIIDGVFGLGFSGQLQPSDLPAQALTEAAALKVTGKDAGHLVIAIDLPSGLDADVGSADSAFLPADVTVTFGSVKLVHILAPARDLCGRVIAIDIGFPQLAVDTALQTHVPAFMIPDPVALIETDPWSKLPRSAHKYDRGHVLVIGGSSGKAGAPLLAAMAALRAGAGWVTVAMPESANAQIHGEVAPEITFEDLFQGEMLDANRLASFMRDRRVRAVVIGPGTMVSPLTPAVMKVLSAFTADQHGAVVLDAGATHGIVEMLEQDGSQAMRQGLWILTPHPGEWAKLGKSLVEAPLTLPGLTATRALTQRLGVNLLYKHATPVLVSPHAELPAYIAVEGSAALARAGSGDVLAGVIGAHAAIGMTSEPAVMRAQTVVAWAARLAVEKVGPQAVVASDVIEQLGLVVV